MCLCCCIAVVLVQHSMLVGIPAFALIRGSLQIMAHTNYGLLQAVAYTRGLHAQHRANPTCTHAGPPRMVPQRDVVPHLLCISPGRQSIAAMLRHMQHPSRQSCQSLTTSVVTLLLSSSVPFCPSAAVCCYSVTLSCDDAAHTSVGTDSAFMP